MNVGLGHCMWEFHLGPGCLFVIQVVWALPSTYRSVSLVRHHVWASLWNVWYIIAWIFVLSVSNIACNECLQCALSMTKMGSHFGYLIGAYLWVVVFHFSLIRLFWIDVNEMYPVMVRNILQDVGICSYVQFIGQRSPHLVLSLTFDWVFSYGWPEMSWDYAAPCTRARIVYCLMHWV